MFLLGPSILFSIQMFKLKRASVHSILYQLNNQIQFILLMHLLLKKYHSNNGIFLWKSDPQQCDNKSGDGCRYSHHNWRKWQENAEKKLLGMTAPVSREKNIGTIARTNICDDIGICQREMGLEQTGSIFCSFVLHEK